MHTASFYSQTWGPENLELLARFYDKYPEYVEKTVLCVKVCLCFCVFLFLFSSPVSLGTCDVVR